MPAASATADWESSRARGLLVVGRLAHRAAQRRRAGVEQSTCCLCSTSEEPPRHARWSALLCDLLRNQHLIFMFQQRFVP